MADSKWGGIRQFAGDLLMAVFDDDSSLTSQEVAEAELRRRVEPLLSICERVLRRPTVAISQDGEDLRKELATWQSK